MLMDVLYSEVPFYNRWCDRIIALCGAVATLTGAWGEGTNLSCRYIGGSVLLCAALWHCLPARLAISGGRHMPAAPRGAKLPMRVTWVRGSDEFAAVASARRLVNADTLKGVRLNFALEVAKLRGATLGWIQGRLGQRRHWLGRRWRNLGLPDPVGTSSDPRNGDRASPSQSLLRINVRVPDAVGKTRYVPDVRDVRVQSDWMGESRRDGCQGCELQARRT